LNHKDTKDTKKEKKRFYFLNHRDAEDAEVRKGGEVNEIKFKSKI
jgi:hypothetical protein